MKGGYNGEKNCCISAINYRGDGGHNFKYLPRMQFAVFAVTHNTPCS